MSYYKDPENMFNKRAKKDQKSADAEYAQYKEAQENGNTQEAQAHYLKSQHYYTSEKENEESKKKYKGKSWSDLKSK
jgi:hypothetical protein